MGLKSLIQALKQNSGNPQVKAHLGGPMCMLSDTVPDLFGADAISNNPLELLSFLKGFVAKPDRSH
jgi:hypothetical protein